MAGFAVALKNIENAAAPFKLGETAEETSSGSDYSMFGKEVEERKSEAVEAL